MKVFYASLLLVLALSCSPKKNINQVQNTPESKEEYAIVIHGGAGYMNKVNFSAERRQKYQDILNEALTKGEDILKKGGSALDAVTQSIMILEDSPLFNAGKGAVFASDTTNQLDASIMTGHDQNAGAVAGVTTVKNPITAAKAVMEDSPHVILSGDGAELFAEASGCTIVDPSYFETKKSLDALIRAQSSMGSVFNDNKEKMGTVGCVALDKNGNIAAGTSTGGMTNKKFNRIGDSPIIGAGTYADQNCGISCTGHGEYFIRYAVAYDIAARVQYLNESIDKAASFVIHEKLKEKGGAGGVIALDKYGNISMPFNTSGMFRAYSKSGQREVLIF